jgi:hypothetical protein
MATLNINAPIGEVLDQIKIRKPRLAALDVSRYISSSKKYSDYAKNGR